MFATNLKIALVVLGTILFYTYLASAIPQVQSEVPQELSLGAEVTAEELVSAGEQLYFGAGGCTACHGTGTRAPNIVGDAPEGPMGVRCATRVPGQPCKEYLWNALVNPNDHVVPGFQPIMPDMSRTLSPAQLWALVAFMEAQGGEVTVTGADIEAAQTGSGGAPAAGAAPAPASTTTDPLTLLREHQCIACHQLAGEGAPLGPPFDGMGGRLDAAEIRRSILEPQARIAPGYEALAGVMPTTFGSQLTAAQLESIVQYLSGLR